MLALGRGIQSLCLSCICLLAMHTLIRVTFSLPPGVRGWLRLLLVALPGLFCLPFFTGYAGDTTQYYKRRMRTPRAVVCVFFVPEVE